MFESFVHTTTATPSRVQPYHKSPSGTGWDYAPLAVCAPCLSLSCGLRRRWDAAKLDVCAVSTVGRADFIFLLDGKWIQTRNHPIDRDLQVAGSTAVIASFFLSLSLAEYNKRILFWCHTKSVLIAPPFCGKYCTHLALTIICFVLSFFEGENTSMPTESTTHYCITASKVVNEPHALSHIG